MSSRCAVSSLLALAAMACDSSSEHASLPAAANESAPHPSNAGSPPSPPGPSSPSETGSDAYVISANGLVVDPVDTQWNLHFDHDSQVEFGKRYAQTMLQALAW